MNQQQAQDVARVGKMLSEVTRVSIVGILSKNPRTVGALATDMGVLHPYVSGHLALLRMSGLVSRTRKGKEMHYSLNRESLTAMKKFLAGLK